MIITPMMTIKIILFTLIFQASSGHGLQVPAQIQESGSPLSFIVDGKVNTCAINSSVFVNQFVGIPT